MTPGLLSAAVFFLVASATLWFSYRASTWRARALERLAPRPTMVMSFLPSPALIWRRLVERVGAVVPDSSKDQPLVKQRLIRAGFRRPGSVRLFRGIRWVSMGVIMAALAAIALSSGLPIENAAFAMVAAGIFGYMAPMQFLLVRMRRRQRAIEKGLPNALDLMVVCVESGLGIDQTIIQVAKELQTAHPEICEEFTVMNLELRAGKRRHAALHNLAERAGVEDLKKLVAVLVQTDRFGTSIAQSLRGHAGYLRALARQRAEERAAKLAVKLVFPIFFCVLPTLFVVTVGPALTRLIRDLIPLIENL